MINYLDELTTKESQVAELVADGLQNKEIANILNITKKTVATHLSNIYKKLRLSNRVELMLYVVQNRYTN